MVQGLNHVKPEPRLQWPKAVVHFIDYVRARAAEPCGPTVPNQALGALAWTERAAGFDPNARLASRPEAQQAVAQVVVLPPTLNVIIFLALGS
mgnify:CR=1 FL=1